MTHPTHGLDHNALEALRNELEGEYGEKVIGKQTLYWLVTAYLAALSQNPGTSNTSGEAVGVKIKPLEWGPESGLGFHRADTPFGQYVIMTKLPPIPEVTWWFGIRHGNDKMAPSLAEAKAAAQADYEQRILAALEPRASDREAVAVEALKQYQAAIASCLTAGGVPINDLGQPQSWWTEIIEAQQSGSAAIRKLSEVSHEH
jgi:hypothetical protein